jgi:hypothetical protein
MARYDPVLVLWACCQSCYTIGVIESHGRNFIAILIKIDQINLLIKALQTLFSSAKVPKTHRFLSLSPAWLTKIRD